MERVVEVQAPSYRSQPDLSGIYYNIPLTGPNNGNVQFNAIGGPTDQTPIPNFFFAAELSTRFG